eukprot:9015158-Alexandrium_andersonii.AAC.1
MDKGGFGLKDAPRLFGLKRDQVLREQKLRPLHSDPQLWIRTNIGELLFMVSTHLDDLKMTAPQWELDAFIATLEKVFGNLAKHKGEFVHCGLRHRQLDDFTVLTDQADYVKNL